MKIKDMTVKELKAHIKAKNLTYSIPGYTKMTKTNLIEALLALNKKSKPKPTTGQVLKKGKKCSKPEGECKCKMY